MGWGFRPEVEGAHDEAALEQGPGYNVNDGVIVAPTQGRIGMRDNCAVLVPERRPGRRCEGLRMVDATIEGEAVVEAGKGEGQGGLGEHGRRKGRRLGHAGQARGDAGDAAGDARCRRCAGVQVWSVVGVVGAWQAAVSSSLISAGPRGTGKARQLWWGWISRPSRFPAVAVTYPRKPLSWQFWASVCFLKNNICCPCIYSFGIVSF